MQVLTTICFDLELELPYQYVQEFVSRFCDKEHREAVKDTASLFVNDSCKLPLCVFYHPKEVGAAAIFLAARWRKNKGLPPGIPL